MARRTVQAGYLARRIGELQAQGQTRRQIAASTGIGERTQRKLAAGETSGTRVYPRVIPRGLGRAGRRGIDIPRSAEPGHFSIVVQNPDGSYMRIPVILRDYERAQHLTVFDKARIVNNTNVQGVVRSEVEKRYPGAAGTRLATGRVMDVVPIIHSHTADIPMVRL